ncbi:MAG: response regulator [Myxococcota bacterium]
MPATVLCIHEDRNVARIHTEMLEAEGYEVVCAFDGRQSLEIARTRPPDFTVIDAYLPRQDGFEILAEMRRLEACRATPVLILSAGEVTADVVERANALGAIGIEASPVAGDRLVSRIADCLKASPPPLSGEPSVPESGCLRALPVPELIHGLRKDRHDGVLVLEHGRKKKAVEFKEGWPVSVKSNLLSECFGNYLVKQGIVDESLLGESVKRMRAGEGMQGEILVAMDVLEEDALVEALRDHGLAKFFELFGWRDGRYALRPRAHVQRGSSIGIDGHPARLVVEGIRRNFPLKQIDRWLTAHANAFLAPNEGGEVRIEDVHPSPREREWIAGLEPSVTLGSLIDRPEWVRRFVFGLITIEALTTDEKQADAGEAQVFASHAARVATLEPSLAEEEARDELARLANRMRGKDFYGVLDVGSAADDEEIRIAFASLSQKTHPDRYHSGSSSVRQLASQVHRKIAEAHEALATEAGRAQYAKDLAQGAREEAVEDEGKRALLAETEFQKGEVLLADRDYEGALLCFGRAMQNFPSEGEYRSHYGWALYLCHPENDVMLGEALEHCREGVKLAKDREKPYLLLGRLYKAMGKAVAAKKMFSRAVQIKPQCVEAMRELRIMNMRRGKDQAQGLGRLKKLFGR